MKACLFQKSSLLTISRLLRDASPGYIRLLTSYFLMDVMSVESGLTGLVLEYRDMTTDDDLVGLN